MYVVRKQLYIEAHQEAQLKRRARELGVSEAELVRRALDAALAGDADVLRHPGRVGAAEELLAAFDRIARAGKLTPDAHDREGLYAERMAALGRGSRWASSTR